MSNSLLRTDREITEIYNRNINTVYQVCFMYMKNKYDTEDMVQATFLKVIEKNIFFENDKHEKAWLIVTASNMCKNNLKHWWRKNKMIEEDSASLKKEYDETLNILLNLPDKYKTVLYMYYYSGYKVKEIAQFLNTNESTIKSYLLRGRNLLKEELEDKNE